jgi:Ca-activated chloride channel family protein
MAMARRKRRGKSKGVVAIVMFAVIVGIGILSSVDFDDFLPRGVMSYDKAVDSLANKVDEVNWSARHVRASGGVTVQKSSLEDSLPPIGKYPLAVMGRGGVDVEIFVSTEKSGSGTDGWMVEAAESFNASGARTASGRPARVSIRKIASGTGFQFIASGKYRPDAYSPSNHLWVRMAEVRGARMTPIAEKTVGNIAGIVMKDQVAEEIEQAAGQVSVPAIIDAAVQGRIAVGYTNPYASSTGLNFLVTVLMTFAQGSEAAMLTGDVASAFEAFQASVPFVAMTTLQMRDSVRQDGSLDAFVMEYQTFIKTAELQSGYRFIPFGIRHDNPLYAVGEPGPEKMEVLKQFAKFMDSRNLRDKAEEYGFNPNISHDPPFQSPSGESLVAAQQLWKQKKDAGRRISAVFLADVSGSMEGVRMRELKRALTDGSSFIASDNSIGLVAFSDRVTVLLPIKQFQMVQQSAFHTAIRGLSTGGKTAMYDGIAVSLSMLVEEKQKDPNVKPVLFVLTDGETNFGMEYGDVDNVIEGLQIPVYTIGFEANIDELKKLSSLVEAASLNAKTDDVGYTIGALLNTQM